MGLPKKEIKALLDMARAVLSGDDEEAIRALSLNIKAHDHCRMIRAQREEEAKRWKELEYRIAASTARLCRLEAFAREVPR